jgi:DNA-directed RNA polymerase subunit RPC12/RpoP
MPSGDSVDIINEIGDQQGWNDNSKLVLCLQYIENQQSSDAFRDFLHQQADDENGLTEGESDLVKDHYPDGECPDCGEPIDDKATAGDACPNCSHVFFLPAPTDDGSTNAEKISVKIFWGTDSTKDENPNLVPQEYTFNTEAEKEAFLLGVAEGQDWDEFEILNGDG